VIVGRIFEHPAPPLALERSPVRSELFGAERLEQHARSLAAAQPVTAGRARDGRLADRLADNAAFLLQANRALAKSAGDGHHATPAADWLADNYHLVDMQVREIGVDLPPGFYAQLPKLAAGPFTGLPRVFGAMWSLLAHADSHLDLEALRRHLLAYQSVQPLSIGELWAVPITLLIVLIENLRRVAELVVDDAAARQAGDELADRMESAGSDAPNLPDSLPGDMRVTDPFSVQLAHRLTTIGASATAWRGAVSFPARPTRPPSGAHSFPGADRGRFKTSAGEKPCSARPIWRSSPLRSSLARR